jgi:hypothetical protein
MTPRPHNSYPLNPRQWAEQAHATGPLTLDEPTNPHDQEESNAFIRDFHTS